MPTLTMHDTTDSPTHFTDVDDFSADALAELLTAAAAAKAGELDDGDALAGQTLSMLFEKPSTRTRVSFETGMTQLGGHAQFLGPDDLQLGAGEPLKDTARALSRYVDGVVARLFDDDDLATLAEHATVPVVNGLTDDAHPCQTLADLLTLRETVGLDAEVAWVGDANNVCRSFVLGCAMLGVDLTVATPAGYALPEAHLDHAADLGTAPATTTDPEAAVAGADAVYTDVWVSMGEEAAREEKLPAFEDGGFTVDADLMAAAADDAVLMHCLPAHRGEEVTETVLEGERSVVWDQAENRLHAQKALLTELMG
ncbi:MAG: ornithine carbamoyltransferase [Halolamina sp.]